MAHQTQDPQVAALLARSARLRNGVREARIQTKISLEHSRALIAATQGLIETSQMEIAAVRCLLRHDSVAPRRGESLFRA